MKAFLASMVAIAVIAAVAAYSLGALDRSAENVYRSQASVRL